MLTGEQLGGEVNEYFLSFAVQAPPHPVLRLGRKRKRNEFSEFPRSWAWGEHGENYYKGKYEEKGSTVY